MELVRPKLRRYGRLLTSAGKMEIMAAVMEELRSREIYKADMYAPYYVCSYAVHAFNLMNRRREIYWEAKRLPNMRLHILFVAPAGFMKSFYLQNMGGDKYAVFRNGGITIGAEQSMTEAGFIGTMRNDAGTTVRTEGAAETYANGIITIDEFAAVTNAMKVQYNNQMDAQLLSALDHGDVSKRLGSGKIEYTTNLTLWAGVQPAKYDLSSGLGRRLCFLVFLPTRTDNEHLMAAMHKGRNARPDLVNMNKLWSGIESWCKQMDSIDRVDYDDSVFGMYKKLGLFSYETSYFDRIVLGWHLATYGPEKHMTITANDKELQKLVLKEKSWREQIGQGIDYIQLRKIILVCGVEDEKEKMISIRKDELVKECVMVGWNAQQVHECLLEMAKYGMISLKAQTVMMEDDTSMS
jgi:hypothetical protein